MVVTSASTYVCSWVISSVFLAAPGAVSPDTQIAAITIPSADVTLSFVQPGRISEIHFKAAWGEDGATSGRVRLNDFAIVPEPATLCLLALGGLLVSRKRRA